MVPSHRVCGPTGPTSHSPGFQPWVNADNALGLRTPTAFPSLRCATCLNPYHRSTSTSFSPRKVDDHSFATLHYAKNCSPTWSAFARAMNLLLFALGAGKITSISCADRAARSQPLNSSRFSRPVPRYGSRRRFHVCETFIGKPDMAHSRLALGMSMHWSITSETKTSIIVGRPFRMSCGGSARSVVLRLMSGTCGIDGNLVEENTVGVRRTDDDQVPRVETLG